jgi:hypothetical protein
MARAKQQTKERRTTIEGVPEPDVLKEAATRWPKVVCKIKRQTGRGRWSSIGNETFEPMDLANCEEYIQKRAGGGRYRFEPLNPMNHAEWAEPLPAFEFEVEGMPKPAAPAEYGTPGGGGSIYTPEQAMAHMNSYSNQPPHVHGAPQPQQEAPHYVNPLLVPPWARDLPPAMQASVAFGRPGMVPPQQSQAQPNDGRYSGNNTWAYTPDTVAMQQLEATRRELERERQKHEQTRREQVEQQQQSMRELDKLREEMRAQSAENERRAFQMQLETMKQQMQQQPAKPALNLGELAPVLAAVAPVLQALFESNSRKTTTQYESASRAQEKLTEALLTQKREDPLKGFKEILTVVGPLVFPAVADLLKSKTPQEQANLYAMLTESNMTQMTMMSEFISQMAEKTGSTEQWWYPMLQNGLDSVKLLAEQMSVGQRKLVSSEDGVQQRQHAQQPAQTEGQKIAVKIVGLPGFPQDLATTEFKDIIAALHDKMDPEQVADYIARHLVGLANAGHLPELLHDFTNNPAGSLQRLVENLPAYQTDSAYVLDVVKRTAIKTRELSQANRQDPVDVQGEDVERPEQAPPSAADKSADSHILEADNGAIPFPIGTLQQQRDRQREPVPAGG